MAINSTTVELRKDDVVAGTPAPCALQVYDADEITLYYGVSRVAATPGTHYSITLDGDPAEGATTFSFTPTTALLTAINALITASPTVEENVVFVRRQVEYTSDFEETDGFLRAKIAREFDRTIMRFQQIAYDVDFANSFVGEFSALAVQVDIDAAQVAADRVVVNTNKNTVATDKGIVAADKAIVAADKATVATDKGIVAADKAIVAADKATVATDKGLVAADKAIVAADKNSAAASATAAAASAALISAGSLLAGFRNKVINGDFDLWQRGTSASVGGYLADRWNTTVSGSTVVVSRQSHTVGQTDVPEEPKYFLRHVVTSVAGASNRARVYQAIEGVGTLAGRTVTVTFYAKADASKNIAISLQQYFGTGGSPSATVIVPCGLKALTTAWQKFSFTAVVPSISGKTIGTNTDHGLYIIAWFDAGSSHNTETSSLGQQSGTFDISRVSIVYGNATTETDPFSARHIQQELNLCKRYYQTGLVRHNSPYGTPAAYLGNATVLSVEMMTTPTITFSSISYGNASGIAAVLVSARSFSSYASVTSNGESGYYANFAAEAEMP